VGGIELAGLKIPGEVAVGVALAGPEQAEVSKASVMVKPSM
jgi:hypothetical protein